jgi:hypothetical protein
MEIRPVGADLFHADRRTEMTKLIDAFRSFAKTSKKSNLHRFLVLFVFLFNDIVKQKFLCAAVKQDTNNN